MSSGSGTALLWLAMNPKTPDDARRLGQGLQQLSAEDPAMRVRTDQLEDQAVIGGMNEQHLETILDRLKREFEVEASVGRPEVAYREALTRPADGEMKYARQADGRGQYAHVKIRLSPGEPGTGYIFENRITGGAVPAEFITAIADGIQDTLARGVLAGYPIEDVRVDLHDGSYHDVDSTEAAFRIAASLAAVDAARKAEPILLEPVMRVEAVVPTECLDDVMKNIVARRGLIQLRQDCGERHVIRALVPLAQLFGYATDLRSRTRGRGTYAMQFAEYLPLQAADDDDGRDSLVGAPRKPAPKLRDSSVALPEPDEDGVGTD